MSSVLNDLDVVMKRLVNRNSSQKEDIERFITNDATQTKLKVSNITIQIIGDEGIRVLCYAIRNTNSIETSKNRYNQLQKNTNVKELVVAQSILNDESVNHLTTSLQTNTTITLVQIKCKNVNVGALAVAKLLKVNRTIQKIALNLFGTKYVSTEIMMEILDSVKENYIVTELYFPGINLLSSISTKSNAQQTKRFNVIKEINFYLALNKAGRRLLLVNMKNGDRSNPPQGIWSYFLAKFHDKPAIMHYFVRAYAKLLSFTKDNGAAMSPITTSTSMKNELASQASIPKDLLIDYSVLMTKLLNCAQRRRSDVYKFVTNDPSLRVLNLSFEEIGTVGTKLIGNVLQGNYNQYVEEIVLYGCSIDNDGMKHIANGLENNKTVIGINMYAISMKDDGAVSFGNMLQINRSLKYLRIDTSCIGERGKEALLQGLQQNFTLEVCHLVGLHKNHSEIDFYLYLNTSGRRLLRAEEEESSVVPDALWSHVLFKVSTKGPPKHLDILYYFVRANPTLYKTT